MEKKRNLWVIPTDKPSKLFIWMDTLLKISSEATNEGSNQNIYITSDEEIKEGDWVLYGASEIIKIELPINKNSEHFKMYGMGARNKIILTTDPQLIQDGVQAIDDEFLEWFVKNPSCENVEIDEKTIDEIEVELNIHGHDIGLTNTEFDEWLQNGGQLYKIIIPKDESFKHECKALTKEEVMEGRSSAYEFIDFDKLDINEISEILTRAHPDFEAEGFSDYQNGRFIGIIEGIEFQQERSYSEEDMIEYAKHTSKYNVITPKEWFEIFKKK